MPLCNDTAGHAWTALRSRSWDIGCPRTPQ